MPLAPLPRRPQSPRDLPARPPLPDPAPLPRASAPAILARGLRWSLVVARVGARLLGDRLRGELDPQRVGQRVREAFELLGGTAVKLGQQLSIRLDLLPAPVCEELSRLTDSARPLPLHVAEAEMTRAFGRPVEEVLAELHPTPLGSASIACVWRARLRTGEAVAVKVQRPEVEAAFTADLGAFDLLSKLMEALTLVRPGFFRNLRSELRTMFLSELDFRAEARSQRLFRRYARRDGMRWVTAPRTFPALCSRRVLVSELVEGITGVELLRLAEQGGAEGAARLRELQIDPRRVGERIMRLAYWGQEECPFFHADPHPGNIIVQPGSRVVMIDFGAVGTTDGKSNRAFASVLASLASGDADLAADYTVVRMGPYPLLDFEAFHDDARRAFREFVRAVDDPAAPWSERTTAAVWLRFLDAVQRHQIPVNLNTLQSMRCSLLYDSLAARLLPDVTFDLFVRHQNKRAEHRAKAWRPQLARAQRRAQATQSPLEGLVLLRRSLAPMERVAADLAASPVVRAAEQIERGLRAAAVMLRLIVVVALVLAFGALTVGAGAGRAVDALRAGASHPAVVLALALALLLGARRLRDALDATSGAALRA